MLPFDRRRAGIGRTGLKAEGTTATRLGLRATAGSGAGQGYKGDLRDQVTMVEVKSTQADTMRLEYGWLRKVADEALYANRSPALSVQFVTGDGRPRADGAWVLVPEGVYRKLTGR
jgi:hypothetical protein